MTDLAELLEARNRHISKSLSVAHGKPLHIVRGEMQYLYAADGTRYLDLVNNVCHVGHCHPHVVAAGQRQMAQLSTNTRYVFDGLTDYLSRLALTLPDPLNVGFLVNSGSEANELAVRLARAHTGSHGMVVVDGAYHGNTDCLCAFFVLWSLYFLEVRKKPFLAGLELHRNRNPEREPIILQDGDRPPDPESGRRAIDLYAELAFGSPFGHLDDTGKIRNGNSSLLDTILLYPQTLRPKAPDRNPGAGKIEILLFELMRFIIFLNGNDEELVGPGAPDLVYLLTRTLYRDLFLPLAAWRKKAHGLSRGTEPHDRRLAGFTRLETNPVRQRSTFHLRLVSNEPDTDGKEQRDQLAAPILGQ